MVSSNSTMAPEAMSGTSQGCSRHSGDLSTWKEWSLGNSFQGKPEDSAQSSRIPREMALLLRPSRAQPAAPLLLFHSWRSTQGVELRPQFCPQEANGVGFPQASVLVVSVPRTSGPGNRGHYWRAAGPGCCPEPGPRKQIGLPWPEQTFPAGRFWQEHSPKLLLEGWGRSSGPRQASRGAWAHSPLCRGTRSRSWREGGTMNGTAGGLSRGGKMT